MNDDSSVHRVAAVVRKLVSDLAPGTRLPSTRELSRAHGVGPVTVQRAVAALVSEGRIETRPGVGNFVAAPRAMRRRDVSWQAAALGPPRPGVPEQAGSGLRGVPDDTIALHSGYPVAELQAGSLVASALARAAKDPAASRPAPSMGLSSLRHLFAAELARAGCDVTADDVLVTSGGQAALVAAFRGLARPGDTVVMESPTFWGAIAAAAEAGLTVVPVATRPDGPDPAELDRVLAMHRARLLYAQPTWHNPTGATWSPAVRSAVLDVLAASGAFLVEDDWARDLSLEGRPPAPLVCGDADGHVVHLRSLTKSMAPGVRVAALVARGPALQRIRASRWAADLYVSPVLQLAAADVLAAPGWQRHLVRLRRELLVRRDALVTALREHAPLAEQPAVPRGGLSLWVALPGRADAGTVAARCLQDGLAVSAGDEWFPAEPDGPYLRLGYAAEPPDQFDRAAQILGRVLDGSWPPQR
jgi:DNA-binding transcriptional MocR family regulator